MCIIIDIQWSDLSKSAHKTLLADAEAIGRVMIDANQIDSIGLECQIMKYMIWPRVWKFTFHSIDDVRWVEMMKKSTFSGHSIHPLQSCIVHYFQLLFLSSFLLRFYFFFKTFFTFIRMVLITHNSMKHVYIIHIRLLLLLLLYASVTVIIPFRKSFEFRCTLCLFSCIRFFSSSLSQTAISAEYTVQVHCTNIVLC